MCHHCWGGGTLKSAVSDTPQEICRLSVKIHWWWLSCSKQVCLSGRCLFKQLERRDKRLFNSWFIRDNQIRIPVVHMVFCGIQCRTFFTLYFSRVCNTALLCITDYGQYFAVNLSDVESRSTYVRIGIWMNIETNNESRLWLSLVPMLLYSGWFDPSACSLLSSCCHIKLLKQRFSAAMLQAVPLHARRVTQCFLAVAKFADQ